MSFADDEGRMLIEVIRQLAKSGTSSERQSKMNQLQHQLERLDDQMDEVVEEHHQSFSTALESFMELIARMDNARYHAVYIRQALLACKTLLKLNHDRIRQLYIEGIEYKETIRLYEDIGNIQRVPPQIDELVAQKRFVVAAELIASTRQKLRAFRENTAMRHLQRAIKTKTIMLKDAVIHELHRQLFLQDKKTREGFDDLVPDNVTRALLEQKEPKDVVPHDDVLKYLYFLANALSILGATHLAIDTLRRTRVADISHLIDKSIGHCQINVIPNIPRQRKKGNFSASEGKFTPITSEALTMKFIGAAMASFGSNNAATSIDSQHQGRDSVPKSSQLPADGHQGNSSAVSNTPGLLQKQTYKRTHKRMGSATATNITTTTESAPTLSSGTTSKNPASMSEGDTSVSTASDVSIAPHIMFHMFQDVLLQLRRSLVAHLCFFRIVKMVQVATGRERRTLHLGSLAPKPANSDGQEPKDAARTDGISADDGGLGDVPKRGLNASVGYPVDSAVGPIRPGSIDPVFLSADEQSSAMFDDADDDLWWLGDEDDSRPTSVEQTPSSTPRLKRSQLGALKKFAGGKDGSSTPNGTKDKDKDKERDRDRDRVRDREKLHAQLVELAANAQQQSLDHDERELWATIQSEIVRLVYPYLDIGTDSVPVILENVQQGTRPPRQSIISTQAGSAAFQLRDVLARFDAKKEREKLLTSDKISFSFANSEHAIFSTAALGERQMTSDATVLEKYDAYTQSDGMERVKYCAPTITNILGLFKPIVLFTEDAELMYNEARSASGLRLLLDEYVKQRYIGHLQETVRQRVTALGDGLSFASETLYEVAPNVNVISSTRDMWHTVCWLCTVIFDLPHYTEDVVKVIAHALQKYLEFCKVRVAFLAKSRAPHSTARSGDDVISVEWLKSTDLVAVLRNTPVYQAVRDECWGRAHSPASPARNETLSQSNGPSPVSTPPSSTPTTSRSRAPSNAGEDIKMPGSKRDRSPSSSIKFLRERHASMLRALDETDVDDYCLVSQGACPITCSQESEIVWQLLKNNLLEKSDVVSEVSSLTLSAHLCESMEWIGKRVSDVTHVLISSPSALRSLWANTSEAVIKNDSDFAAHVIEGLMTPTIVKSLSDIAQEFSALSSEILLFLRMELRCRGLLYILPILKHANYFCDFEAVETDPQIIQFNRAFLSIDEALSASLSPTKKAYVLENFEGFLADLFIRGMAFVRRINENGIKRMCRNILAVQQTLRSITRMNTVALDLATQYYEMLNMTPKEVLDSIASMNSPPYTEVQYRVLLKLMQTSSKIPEAPEYNEALESLNSVYNDVI